MAQKKVTVFVDDLTGKELSASSVETVRFSLDGVGYELDVDRSTAEQLRASMSPFVAAGRRLPGGGMVGSRRVKTAAAPTAVRAWAAANGVKVSDRGRIPADVLSQFEAAGN